MKPADSERGAISITAALFAAALFGLIAALITHGQFTNSYTTTREAATNAARAGTQEINIDHYLDTGEKKLDTAKAEATVRDHIATYPNLKIVDLQVTETRIEVTVSETVTGVTGITKTITSEGRAVPLQDR